MCIARHENWSVLIASVMEQAAKQENLKSCYEDCKKVCGGAGD